MFVLVKQVPDTAPRSAEQPRTIDQTGITWIVSPYDEFALEEALRSRRSGIRRATRSSRDPRSGAEPKEALRSCLAMGADRAIHVNDPAFEGADTLTAAGPWPRW